MNPKIAVTGPFASSWQQSLACTIFWEKPQNQQQLLQSERYMSEIVKESTSRISNEPEIPMVPSAAKSSPQSIVVPTAMYSLLPVSILIVSSVTRDMALMNSFIANSNLGPVSIRKYLFYLRKVPTHSHPGIRGNEL